MSLTISCKCTIGWSLYVLWPFYTCPATLKVFTVATVWALWLKWSSWLVMMVQLGSLGLKTHANFHWLTKQKKCFILWILFNTDDMGWESSGRRRRVNRWDNWTGQQLSLTFRTDHKIHDQGRQVVAIGFVFCVVLLVLSGEKTSITITLYMCWILLNFYDEFI